MATDTGFKHDRFRASLVSAIRRGELRVGQQLPTDRELADRHGVSYLTVRRALRDLVEDELLIRRPRQGTFVAPMADVRLRSTTLHLVCDSYEGLFQRLFLTYGSAAARERGWLPRVVRFQPDEVLPVVRTIERGEPTLLMLSGPEWNDSIVAALCKAEGRAILIGHQPSGACVPGINVDDESGLRLAVDRLWSLGHRRIAFLDAHRDHPAGRQRDALWLKLMGERCGEREAAGRLLSFQTPAGQDPARGAYEATSRHLDGVGRQTTALVCSGEEAAIGALAACVDAGRQVPQQMSLINFGPQWISEFSRPRLARIDPGLDRQIGLALPHLEEAYARKADHAGLQVLVEPEWVEGESVGPAVW